MKRIITLVIFSFLLLPHTNVSAKHIQTQLDTIQNKIESIDTRVRQNVKEINDIHNKTTDDALFRKLEIIEKDIYDSDHRHYIDTANFMLAIISLLFVAGFAFFGVSIWFSKKKWKEDFDNTINELKSTIKEQTNDFKKEIEGKLEETKISFYYRFGIKFFNDKNYPVALDFFEPLYNSEYRQSDVRFYLARCYFYTKDYNKVVKYLKEALSTTDDNLKAYGIFYFIREILQNNNLSQNLKDEICDFLNNEYTNPRNYYKKNTKTFIKEIINKYCIEEEEAE